jgi:carbon storage regulator
MLVLSRKPTGKILIGEDIEIEILAVNGNKVRIGITAPRNVAVNRHEVVERNRRKEAAEPHRDVAAP